MCEKSLTLPLMHSPLVHLPPLRSSLASIPDPPPPPPPRAVKAPNDLPHIRPLALGSALGPLVISLCHPLKHFTTLF